MIKIHKTYLHERSEAPRDAPARRLDDRRRLRSVLADAPPAEALEGAREALEARGRAEELLEVLADGAAPPPLLLAEAPAERAPPRPELAERGVAADVPHVGAGVEVGRRGAAAAQAQAQRVVGRRPLGVVVPEQPAVPDAVAAAPVAVQGLGLGPGRRARRGVSASRAGKPRSKEQLFGWGSFRRRDGYREDQVGEGMAGSYGALTASLSRPRPFSLRDTSPASAW